MIEICSINSGVRWKYEHYWLRYYNRFTVVLEFGENATMFWYLYLTFSRFFHEIHGRIAVMIMATNISSKWRFFNACVQRALLKLQISYLHHRQSCLSRSLKHALIILWYWLCLLNIHFQPPTKSYMSFINEVGPLLYEIIAFVGSDNTQ